MLWLVIIASIACGLLSLVGGIILLANKKKAPRFAEYATAFAAGALLAAAFVDLLPEAIEESNAHSVLLATLIGLLFFFLLEGAINWFHRHAHKHDPKDKKLAPVVPMVVLGDTLHNFIDGIAIAAGFLISPASGLIVTFAIAAHEIPQEIGDFGIMAKNGVSRRRIIFMNLISSFAAVISAVIFYLLGSTHDISLAPLLGLVAGFFIYIAATDIIPTLHQEPKKSATIKKSALLLLGVIVISVAVTFLHTHAH